MALSQRSSSRAAGEISLQRVIQEDQTGCKVPAGLGRTGNEQRQGHFPANLGHPVPRVGRGELGGYADGTRSLGGRPTPHVRAGAGEINASKWLQSRGGIATVAARAPLPRRHTGGMIPRAAARRTAAGNPSAGEADARASAINVPLRRRRQAWRFRPTGSGNSRPRRGTPKYPF